MVIWKFPLQLITEQRLEVPASAKFLDLQMQNGRPTLWALVDETDTKVTVKDVVMVGTGHQFSKNLTMSNYVGTVQDGMYVWHFFFRNVN